MSGLRTLPSEVRRRLAMILGMCGSSHAGERAAAALKASEPLKQHNASWFDVVAPEPAADTPQEPRRHEYTSQHEQAASDLDWPEMAEAILNSGRASQWEENFCERLLNEWHGRLTEKQSACITRIFRERVERYRRAS